MENFYRQKELEIMIINSPLFREKLNCFNEDTLPPIGLGYIATNLKNNLISCKLIDSVAENIPIVNLISMIENSNETKQDFQKTFQLASFLKNQSKKTTGSFRCSVFQFRPYHGTKIYYNLLKKQPDDIKKMRANYILSEKIGRRQFNFSSGVFSKCGQETIDEYIERTLALNNI